MPRPRWDNHPALVAFASQVEAAARAVQASARRGREKRRVWGDTKVWIAAVYDEARRRGYRDSSEAFKRRLYAAQQRGALNLSRCDLVEAGDDDMLARSAMYLSAIDRQVYEGETWSWSPVASWHLVRLGK